MHRSGPMLRPNATGKAVGREEAMSIEPTLSFHTFNKIKASVCNDNKRHFGFGKQLHMSTKKQSSSQKIT